MCVTFRATPQTLARSTGDLQLTFGNAASITRRGRRFIPEIEKCYSDSKGTAIEGKNMAFEAVGAKLKGARESLAAVVELYENEISSIRPVVKYGIDAMLILVPLIGMTYFLFYPEAFNAFVAWLYRVL
jgi:hypothetical protein